MRNPNSMLMIGTALIAGFVAIASLTLGSFFDIPIITPSDAPTVVMNEVVVHVSPLMAAAPTVCKSNDSIAQR